MKTQIYGQPENMKCFMFCLIYIYILRKLINVNIIPLFALLCLVFLQVSSFLSHLQFSFSCKFCRLAELLARTGQHQQRMMKEDHRSSPENIFVIITLRITSNLTNVAMSHCLSIAKPWSRLQSANLVPASRLCIIQPV